MRKTHKFFVIVIFILMVCQFIPVNAEETVYKVADAGEGMINVIEEFSDYSSAVSFYNASTDDYSNLILLENDRVIEMEYGIVSFLNRSPVSYYSITNAEAAILDSTYAADAAYIKTRSDRVYFRLSGTDGYTDKKNVELIPFELIHGDPSLYRIKDGVLYHCVNTENRSLYFNRVYPIDYAPDFMSEESFYSYDGHYFYDDFRVMIDDCRDSSFENAINAEEVYYNYYQYLPFHSRTLYTLKEVEDLFYGTFGINGKLDSYVDKDGDGANDKVNLSQYYGEIETFFKAENRYGTNALMLLSLANVESHYGKSFSSYVDNSLFNVFALDSDSERDNHKYNSVSDGILSYAQYVISGRYSNHLRVNYSGVFPGDMANGLGRQLSPDPYWGEKTASEYFEMDRKLGMKDYRSNSLAIVEDSSISLFRDKNLSHPYYTIKEKNIFSLIVTDEKSESFEVQLDQTQGGFCEYDFDSSIGYIAKDVVDHLLNEEMAHRFNGEKVEEESAPLISKTEVLSAPKMQIEYGDAISLKNTKIRITYDNGKKETIPITSDMISFYDPYQEGEQDVYIGYGDLAVRMKLTVKEKSDVSDIAKELCNALRNGEEINSKDLVYVLNNIASADLNWDEIRLLDSYVISTDNPSFNVEENDLNLSVSGLTLSFPSRNDIHPFLEDTYYVTVGEGKKKDTDRICQLAQGYGFEKNMSLKLSFRYNFEIAEPASEVIVSVKIQDKDIDRIFTVYHMDRQGNIVKCRSEQSRNYVQFEAKESGTYVILEKQGINSYAIDDMPEIISEYNNGFNYLQFALEVMLFALLMLLGLIQCCFYYIVDSQRRKQWRGYRRSLRRVAFVPEEKRKN